MPSPTLAPFRGITFDPTRVCMDDVVTQPYDKIDAQMRSGYDARGAYNFADVILPRGERATARSKVDAWLAEGVLRRDEAPALYVYEQRFRGTGDTWQTRRGVYTLVGVQPWEAGAVLAHEVTFDPPRQDRLAFREQTHLNAEPVFLIYDDPERAADTAIDALCAGAPLLEATDEAGEAHRVWRTDDAATVDALMSALSGHQLFVADGHHRYEAALAHSQACAAAGQPTGGVPGAEGCLAVLFNIASGGLPIWPTHRVVRSEVAFDPGWLLGQLARIQFDVKTYRREALADAWDGLDGAWPGFLMAVGAFPDHVFRLVFEPMHPQQVPTPGSPLWNRLDVNVLQHVLFPVLGITRPELQRKEKVDFIRGDAKALDLLDAGTHSAAFLMRPVSVDTVCEIARGGERMPQKSTDFYPKLLSGLVLHALELP